MIDTEGVVTFSSGMSLAAIGLTPQDVMGRSVFTDLFAEHPEVREATRLALRGEQVHTVDRVRGRFFETFCGPIRDEQGVVTGAIGVSTDITERVQAEEERRASDIRYRQLVETAQEGIWQFDATYRTTQVNAKLAAMLGYTPQEMLGRGLFAFMDDRGRARAQAAMVAHPQGHTEPHEYRLVRKDGTPIWALITSVLQHDTQGRLLGSFAMVTEITGRKRAEQRLVHEAYHDALTGLANRRLFRDRLAQALEEARRYRRPLAILLLDCNHFKAINDTDGHEAGDLFLQELATRTRRSVRAADTVARLGGDEFAVLLPETGAAGAERTARTILRALTRPLVLGTHPLPFSVSIGMAVAPRDGLDSRMLLRAADLAMYAAKREGGGFRPVAQPFTTSGA